MNITVNQFYLAAIKVSILNTNNVGVLGHFAI